MSLFEKASRLKLRFNTSKGSITTEQLWDLSLEDLDLMYVQLEKLVPNASLTGLIKKRSNKQAKELELKIELIAHVFNTRQQEVTESQERVAVIERNKKIDDLIAKKKDQSLENLSIEELEKLKNKG